MGYELFYFQGGPNYDVKGEDKMDESGYDEDLVLESFREDFTCPSLKEHEVSYRLIF